MNGCPTGKHTFSDLAGYCAALKDEALNRGCAKSIREQDYEKKCQPATASAAPAPTGGLNAENKSGKTLQAPIEQFNFPATILKAPPEQEKIEVPSTVVIRAQQTTIISPRTDVREYVTLSGILEVVSTEPDIADQSLNLAGASSTKITEPALGSCTLAFLDFTLQNAVGLGPTKKQIGFTLGGPSQKEADNDCNIKILMMTLTGFSVEFENVRLGAVHSTVIVPKVRLEVSPRPDSL